ncbi:hypothetical protein AGMMS50229_01850 [Campylobacterota bacterium]|nr:hypothetical protein AGMMS50229_01850 [Campylobacterota bacterium]
MKAGFRSERGDSIALTRYAKQNEKQSTKWLACTRMTNALTSIERMLIVYLIYAMS